MSNRKPRLLIGSIFSASLAIALPSAAHGAEHRRRPSRAACATTRCGG